MKHGKIGRYELLHKIAAGGMAEIFLARQWGQGGFFRDVVIKRLFPHYAEHEHALRRWLEQQQLALELGPFGVGRRRAATLGEQTYAW